MSVLIQNMEMPHGVGRQVTIYPDGRVVEYGLDGAKIVGEAKRVPERASARSGHRKPILYGNCPYWDCPNMNEFGNCKTTACINPKYQSDTFRTTTAL